MKSNWFLYNKKKNINEMSQKFGIDPLTSVILCNRDITADDDVKKILSANIEDINDSKLLPDVDKASEILKKYIDAGKSIRIVGDYDIDGVCSTYILYDAIKNVGGNVSYAIPDRVTDGYGINISIIDKAIEDKVDLIVTCDNGIAAGEQISYAKEHNIEVIITDHHDVGEIPKDASAVINPKRKDVDNPYPFAEICGATVAWKFMDRYYELYHGKKGYIINRYLDFASIATIGDIMPLINENHIIAKIGLRQMLDTTNKGLKRLLDISGIDFASKGVSAYHIGFIIGPLINAAGRLDKATLALKLFITDDEDEIKSIANTLKELNDERKKMTEDGTEFAIEEIEKNYLNDKVIVVFVDGLSEQVAGIVAGRVKEKYNKPTIVLTDTSNEKEAKASCRSIEAYDMFNSLNIHKEMFLKFGGHKLAAGFSILKENIEKLRKLLNEECELSENDFVPKLHIDLEYPMYQFTESLVEEIEELSPFGQGFTKPVFVTRKVTTSIKNIYGKDNNVIQLNLSKDGVRLKGVIFTNSDELKERLSKDSDLDIVYNPKINEFKGYKSVEITVSEYR